MKLEEIMGELDNEKEEFYLTTNLIYVLDKTTLKTLRIYISGDNVDWEKKDLAQMLLDIIAGLKDKFEIEVFLKEFLVTRTPPEILVDVHERIMNNAKVTSKPEECYAFDIGGKRGHPLQLCLIQNLGESG